VKPATRVVASVLCLLSLFAPAAARAQLTNASAIRGKVEDAQGKPVPGVNVEMQFKGESRVKIVKKTVTDKKGGYIYSGLPAGPWVILFTKESYKTTQLSADIPLGGISDVSTVRMAAAESPAAAAAGGDTVAIAAPDAGPGASADRSKELADIYTKAMAARKAGSTAEAEALLKELVAIVPGFGPAHQALASIYAARGDAAAAEASYRKFVEVDGQAAVSHLALSNFLATAGRNDEAFKVLQEAAPRFPQDALLQFALGATAFNIGRNEDAQAAFVKATELDPNNAEPLFYLGSLAVSANDVPKAVGYFEKYVALAPANAPNLGAAKALLQTLKKK
jgi:tetratricopeptide (TPR) repeat protein